MLGALIHGVMWPPSYYVMRDRIPFFLTIVYLYRDRIPFFTKWNRENLGLTLTLGTFGLTVGCIYLYFVEDNMMRLAGIKWSAPSPIEWGTLILVSTVLMVRKKISLFEAYYLSFIAALGGAWLYEFAPMIFSGFDWFIFFKVNAVKVFFMEFQVFCLPLLGSIIVKTKEYERHPLLIPSALFALLFAALNPLVILFVQQNLIYSYRWYVRLPTIIFLFFALLGIKGEKKQ